MLADFHSRRKGKENEIISFLKPMNNIAEKLKRPSKIIVTDSGLGGLAVQALLENN